MCNRSGQVYNNIRGTMNRTEQAARSAYQNTTARARSARDAAGRAVSTASSWGKSAWANMPNMDRTIDFTGDVTAGLIRESRGEKLNKKSRKRKTRKSRNTKKKNFRKKRNSIKRSRSRKR